MRILNAAEAAREATEQLLASSKEYIVIGEGVPDPMACFGTTKGLKEKFPNQVFDSPVSENGIVGICIGAAIAEMKPIFISMRQDFLLYAMDQIVNNAAKWHSMFGGNGGNVPMVIKAFTGRGWGAGHQHAQNLESFFAHIPGLKVVVPSSAHTAKGLLIAAARDPNPVLILEHRWIHHLTSDVPQEMYETQIGKANVIGQGATAIITWGAMVAEAIRAQEFLRSMDTHIKIIDLQSLRPLDVVTIRESLEDCYRACVVCDSWAGGISSHIARVADQALSGEVVNILSAPDFYPSSTPALIKNYYPSYLRIAEWAASRPVGYFGEESLPHDIPDKSFTGPF